MPAQTPNIQKTHRDSDLSHPPARARIKPPTPNVSPHPHAARPRRAAPRRAAPRVSYRCPPNAHTINAG